MTSVTVDQVIEQLLGVLREGCEGPGQWSYFTDSGPEAGLFGALAALDAATASKGVAGSSIAAHAHHVVFALEASAGWIRGERHPRDWDSSWRVQTVDAAAWKQTLADLRTRYEELKAAIGKHAGGSVEALGGAIGVIAHVAYHLGAIKQKLAMLRGM